MDLHLTFERGKMAGEGNDDIGRFVIRGRYDAAALECYWTKAYIGAHEVFYRGFREGKGIWGVWEIGPIARGGFHIWPRQAGEAEAEETSTEESLPVSPLPVHAPTGMPGGTSSSHSGPSVAGQ